MDLSVVIPTHNPHLGRLRTTLAALGTQTLTRERWDVLLIDNASQRFPAPEQLADVAPSHFRIVSAPELGLSAARRAGIAAASGAIIVFVDDDNVLAPDYLAQVLAIFADHPRLGLVGGRSLPSFESPPPAWTHEFFPLLALRDLGPEPILAAPSRGEPPIYPLCAPIGAGMAARREALHSWLAQATALSDRRGAELTSAGDNDIVLCALKADWEVGYFPQLSLTHLIPAARLDPAYLARLNRGIQKSWMQVLTLHAANSWLPIPAWTLPLRRAKAWWTHRAWRGSAERIRWQGACGHFDGRSDLSAR